MKPNNFSLKEQNAAADVIYVYVKGIFGFFTVSKQFLKIKHLNTLSAAQANK